MDQQLEGLSTGEIEALIAAAHDVLARRKAAEKDQRRQQQQRAHEPEATLGEGGSWLEHELVSCGKCTRCLAGEKAHGPYWYLYRYTGSKMVSSYVGRRTPADLAQRLGQRQLADLKPEDAFPDKYPRINSDP